MAKFHVGQKVYSKVDRRSCSEPTTARAYSQFTVCGVRKCGNVYKYEVEDYDLYEFEENELMSSVEYGLSILLGK